MFKILERFLIYLSKFVEDSKTGAPSVKRFGLALAVTILCGILAGLVTTVCLITLQAQPQYVPEIIRTICGTVEVLAGLVLTAVTTGYLVDKAKERNKNVGEQTTTTGSSEDN